MGNDPKGSTEEKIGIFEEKKAALMTMGGEKMVRKQHELGKAHRPRENRSPLRSGELSGGSAFREAPFDAVRSRGEGDPGRRRDHRLRPDQRPDRLCGRPGLHQRRREPRGDACQKDLEGDGHGPRRPEAFYFPERLRRRPDPGGGPLPGGLRRHLLPQHASAPATSPRSRRSWVPRRAGRSIPRP